MAGVSEEARQQFFQLCDSTKNTNYAKNYDAKKPALGILKTNAFLGKIASLIDLHFVF